MQLAMGTAAVSRAGSSVAIDARSAAPASFGGPHLTLVEAETDSALLTAVRPRGGVQRVGLRMYFSQVTPNDTRIDQWLVGGWRVSRSLGRPVQDASFQVAVEDGFSPLGSQIATICPIPALRGSTHLNAFLAYRVDADTEYTHPLFTTGLAADNERRDDGTISDNLSVLDVIARGRLAVHDLRLPAGHGLTYAQVIRKCWQAASSPAAVTSIPTPSGDFQFRKEVQLLAGDDAVALANELADLWGMALYGDEYGIFSGAIYAPESERGPIMGVIDERDILRAVNGQIESVSIRPMPEAWTSVCLEGTIQKTRIDLGRRSVPLPAQTYAHFAPTVARYRHNAGGSYTDTGITEVEADLLRTDSLTTLSVEGETLVAIDSAVKGWTNLSAARYSINASLVLTALGGVYVEEQTSGALAFAWPVQRFVDLSESHTTRQYSTITNRLTRETLETYGHVHPRAAIQSRALRSSSWEDTVNAPGINGRLVLGNGEGVATARAEWGLIERRVIEHDSSDDGYRTYRRTRLYGWARPKGWQYHYGAGPDSTDEFETFQVTSDKEEFWEVVPGREDLHVYRWQEFGPGGELISGGNETRQGALEPAEERTDLAPARDDYDSDAEWALAVAASKFEVQPMHFEKVDQVVIDHYRPATPTQRVTYEFAQAPWQLERVADRTFTKGRARVVGFSVPPNPLYKIGQWWRVRYRKPGMDVDHDGIILDSTFERRGNQGPIIQRLSVAVH